MVGNVCGDKNVFLLDSGASSNFMSKSVVDQYGLKTQDTGKKFTVRLANGRTVTTSDCVRVTVFFGAYHYVGKFYVLDCPVPLILGMDFLSKVQPKINFRTK